MLIQLALAGVVVVSAHVLRRHRAQTSGPHGDGGVDVPPPNEADASPHAAPPEMPEYAEAEAEEVRELERGIALTGGGVVAVAAGRLVSPALGLIAWPCVLIPSVPLIRRAWHDVRVKRAPTFAAIELGGLAAALIAGHVGLCAVGFTIFQGGRRLLLATRRRTRGEIGAAFIAPSEPIRVLRGGEEVVIEHARLQVGDRIVIGAGQVVPCDGRILDGRVAVDEHQLTGESALAERSVGERVFGASLVAWGQAVIVAETTGADAIAARLAALIAGTASHEQTIESDAQAVADASATPTLVAGALGATVGGLSGAVAGLWSNCIDAYWLAAPVCMLGVVRAAADQGILVKDGRSIELLSGIDTVVLDKTGTLTRGTPRVTHVEAAPGWTADRVLRVAAAAERRQPHPIARGIVDAARDAGVWDEALAVSETRYIPGRGLVVDVGGHPVVVGSAGMLADAGIDTPSALDEAAADAPSRVHVARDGHWIGAVTLEADVRPEAAAIVSAMRRSGLDIVMLTGDADAPSRALARQLGIETVYSRVLPEGKAEHVAALRARGRRVCFVGDGINDALAMRRADVSVSLAGASTLAVDSAQIVLCDGTLGRLDALFDLGRHHGRARERMLWAAGGASVVSLGSVLFVGAGPGAVVGMYLAAQGACLGVALDAVRWRSD